jgi:hypothetical protein
MKMSSLLSGFEVTVKCTAQEIETFSSEKGT